MTREAAPPPDVPADWTPFWPFPAGSEGRSFVSGRPSRSRLRVAYFRRAGDDRLLARAWFGPETEGPPDHVHGGAIAAVLDEAMAGACWMHGHRVLAGRLGVTYRKLVPFGTDARVEAWVDLVDGRKISTRARLVDEGGESYAEADGVFVTIL